MKSCVLPWLFITVMLSVFTTWVSGIDIVVKKGNARRLFDDELEIALKKHNEYRKKMGASNMEHMYYHRKLEEQAMKTADKCDWKHSFPEVTDLEWKQTGQNLWLSTGSFDELKGVFNLEGGIKSWYDEIKDYDYSSNSCNDGKVCGHYTQIVWATSNYLGCSYNYCSKLGSFKNAHFLVCNYGPAGNYVGAKPYKSGSGCTECKSGSAECDDGLCKKCSVDGGDCVCQASCYNCGVAPTNGSNCVCTCATGWEGNTCQKNSGSGVTGTCAVATSNIPVKGPAINYDNGSNLKRVSMFILLATILLAAMMTNYQI